LAAPELVQSQMAAAQAPKTGPRRKRELDATRAGAPPLSRPSSS
jgi:hypothetical protein